MAEYHVECEREICFYIQAVVNLAVVVLYPYPEGATADHIYPICRDLDRIYVEIIDTLDANNSDKIIQLGTVLFGYSCDKQIVQAGYLDDCLMGWIDDNQPEIIKPLLERLLAHARDLFSRNRISGSSFDLERYSVAILGCY